MHICEFLRNFAAEMKKTLSILILLCASVLYAHAETVLLRTGARVKGTIVFQNEEVVVIRDAEGARFQYPRTDVQEILADDADQSDRSDQPDSSEEAITTPKKASILLELSGGAAVQPAETAGGAVGADLLVGSHHIGSRHIFIGGGIGYHGLFMGTGRYNFLPVQAAVRMPLTEEKHAPVFGVALGYGIALSKDYLGGVYAGIDFGYRCQLNPRSAIALVGFAQFQQANLSIETVLDGVSYTGRAGRNLVTAGVKLAFYF